MFLWLSSGVVVVVVVVPSPVQECERALVVDVRLDFVVCRVWEVRHAAVIASFGALAGVAKGSLPANVGRDFFWKSSEVLRIHPWNGRCLPSRRPLMAARPQWRPWRGYENFSEQVSCTDHPCLHVNFSYTLFLSCMIT